MKGLRSDGVAKSGSFRLGGHAHMLKSSRAEKKRVAAHAQTHAMYCSVLLNFLARYFADALLGILTKDISLP